MKKHFIFYCQIYIILAVFPCNILSFANDSFHNAQKEKLIEILKKCADYCDRLSNSKLFFSCREKIIEEIYYYRPGAGRILDTLDSIKHKKNIKNIYIYDFQLNLENGKYEIDRTLRKENGKKKFKEDAELKTHLFRDIIVFLEPIAFLGENEQKLYLFKIIGREKFMDKSTIVLKVIPKSKKDREIFKANIWVDEDDYIPIKIKWSQRILGDFPGIRSTANGEDIEPHFTYISEFGFLNNGFYFPSRQVIIEVYLSADKKKRFKRSETTVIYDEYKFFGKKH